MKNEEAIEFLSQYINDEVYTKKCIDAHNLAISALRLALTGDHFPDLTKMVPLTLEELRKMSGQPVWVKVIGKTGIRCDGWCEVEIREKDTFAYVWWPGSEVEDISKIEDYGKAWVCYAYPPAHIDREAWEKPCDMCRGKKALYQHTNTTKLFMNTFGEAATLVTECMACPPYADCCMKGISANSAFKINFCPECGRPLTPEAWAELEKRMGVRV